MDSLGFLSQAWFVVPWYLVGLAGALWVAYDTRFNNRPLNRPVK
jgi:hypothetical protein